MCIVDLAGDAKTITLAHILFAYLRDDNIGPAQGIAGAKDT